MRLLELASKYALPRTPTDPRHFWLGAVGVRGDRATVLARNGSAEQVSPKHHAEARLARKLDSGSTVYIARVSRKDGQWALARPCFTCRMALKSRGVKTVFYTIGPGEWAKVTL